MPNRPETLYRQGSEKTPFRYPYFYPYSKRPVFPLSRTIRFPISTPQNTVRIPIQHRPRVDDCYFTPGEILHIARGQCGPS